MRTEILSAVNHYIESLYPSEDALHLKSRKLAADFGVAGISLGISEAKILSFLFRSSCAKNTLEIGTLSGLSAQYLMQSMASGGKLWTLEKDQIRGEAAQLVLNERAAMLRKENIEITAEVVIGDARETLPALAAKGPFDFVFIDGNKAAYYDYWLFSRENLRKGGILVADNVFLSGAVWGEVGSGKFSDKQIQIMKKFNSEIVKEWDGVVIPTSEGMLVAQKPI